MTDKPILPHDNLEILALPGYGSAQPASGTSRSVPQLENLISLFLLQPPFDPELVIISTWSQLEEEIVIPECFPQVILQVNLSQIVRFVGLPDIPHLG